MNSSTFDKFGYNYTVNYKQAKKNNQIVSIGDSQILRSIRDITGRLYEKDKIELLFNKRNEFKKQPKSKENSIAINEINKEISNIMFIPEYLSLVIDKNSHYKKIIKNGLILNGKKYRRFSCSASQARVNTVILICDAVYENLYNRINNDRKIIQINPSKENAYFGLASSATKVVTEPRVCVIDDCILKRDVFVNWVTTVTEELKDDIIEQKHVNFEFNAFDGMGIIHPSFAIKWAEDLGLDYVPSEFCIRHSFIKGMVCQFDFIKFCEVKNNNNYMIKTLYGDYVDVRNYDVILTKSQFKMWNCYDNYEDYNNKCHKNKLQWGISQYSPKKTKDILTLNYQSIQTLKLSKEDIINLCKQTVELFDNITGKNIFYTILCLLGENISAETISLFMQNSDNFWLKCLLLNNNLIYDRYIQNKIYDNISARLRNTYLGEIYVDGNYQCMVSDPYAFMEFACGKPVIGLLKDKEHYSNYWNKKGISIVDAMRSPLTYRSEHNILNFISNEDTEYWFQYLSGGIVFNVHGDDVIRAADSDFDFDIIATTSNPIVLKGIYKDSLPVAYEKGNTGKGINKFEDLCNADMLAFGSKIGQITNKSTSMYAMLPLFKNDSKQYNEIEKRLILTRVAQGNEIDRAKGILTKPFPKHWTSYNHINEDDDNNIKELKKFYNDILIEKKPLFFKHRYYKDKNEYNSYIKDKNKHCIKTFGCDINTLKSNEFKTLEQVNFLMTLNKYSPLLDTNCEMNNLSNYMTSINFDLKQKLKYESDENMWYEYIDGRVPLDKHVYKKIKIALKKYFNVSKDQNGITAYNCNMEGSLDDFEDTGFSELRSSLNEICYNPKILTDYLVRIFYTETKSANKNILWKLCGKHIFNNMIRDAKSYEIPILSENDEYDFMYMGKKFKIEKVVIKND